MNHRDLKQLNLLLDQLAVELSAPVRAIIRDAQQVVVNQITEKEKEERG